MAGRLYVVGTPLGNLDDLSPRAAATLRRVALIAAEDTRSALRLLAGPARPPLVSFFAGNEAARTAELIARLEGGEDVALISEAGMPGVSDPGERLVAAAVAAGIAVEVIPGPSAAITALVGSGLPADRFTFVGFLPRREGERLEWLGELRLRRETLIFYEAPTRTAETLQSLVAALGPERPACVARELTKLHEEYIRGPLGQLAARFAETPPRGEVTVVVAGSRAEVAAAIDVEAEVAARLARGDSPKEIAAALALATGQPRRQIYQLALALRPRERDPKD